MGQNIINELMYKYIYFGILAIKLSDAVNPNTPLSPPACTIFNEIAQYFKFSMLFSGVTIITSAS